MRKGSQRGSNLGWEESRQGAKKSIWGTQHKGDCILHRKNGKIGRCGLMQTTSLTADF